MTHYRVTWEIDVEAESPREAAQDAFSRITRDGAECLVFNVVAFPEQADPVAVDLNEPDAGKIAPGEFSKTIMAGYTVAWVWDDKTYTAYDDDETGEGWMVTGFKTEREAWASADNHRRLGVFLPPEHPLSADGYEVRPVAVNRWVFDNNDFGDLGEKAGQFSYPEDAWDAAQAHHDLAQHHPNCGRHDGGRCTCDDVELTDNEEA